ncbi:MAG: SWIM zinc finger family protein, partial [Myxococcota bacterium]
ATAKKLAIPAKWDQVGRVGPNIVWGVALGSRGDRYAVYIDISRDALECSCPSRKRPCKHALGLLIMEANGNHTIPEADLPDGHRWEAEDRYYSSWE